MNFFLSSNFHLTNLICNGFFYLRWKPSETCIFSLNSEIIFLKNVRKYEKCCVSSLNDMTDNKKKLQLNIQRGKKEEKYSTSKCVIRILGERKIVILRNFEGRIFSDLFYVFRTCKHVWIFFSSPNIRDVTTFWQKHVPNFVVNRWHSLLSVCKTISPHTLNNETSRLFSWVETKLMFM